MIVAIVSIILGSLIFLIPITGLTARFALKPIMEALRQYQGVRADHEALEMVERRLALLEEQLQGMDREVRALAEDAEFRRRLEEPKGGPGAG